VFLKKSTFKKVGKFTNLKNWSEYSFINNNSQVWDYSIRSLMKNVKFDCLPMSLFWTRRIEKDSKKTSREIRRESRKFCSQVVSKYFSNQNEEKVSGILQFGIGKYNQ
jgi:hypothetical protein